jgi:hypothetical protein
MNYCNIFQGISLYSNLSLEGNQNLFEAEPISILDFLQGGRKGKDFSE